MSPLPFPLNASIPSAFTSPLPPPAAPPLAPSSWTEMKSEALKPRGFFARLLDWFFPATVPAERVEAATKGFKRFFDEQLNAIHGPSHTQGDAAREAMRTILDRIAGDCMGQLLTKSVVVGKALLNKAIVYADHMAQHALSIFRSRIGTPPDGPALQLTCGSKGNINVIRRAPSIDNMVFQGGGAKGVVYPDVLMALEIAGKLPVKTCVGTSAGALTATYLAAGATPTDFARHVSENPMTSYLGTDPDFKARYPHARLPSRLVGYKAGNAIKIVDKYTSETVKAYLSAHWHEPDVQSRMKALPPGSVKRLRQLKDQDLQSEVSRQGNMLTFADMRMLHTLAPDTFKELIVTAWNTDTRTVVYFNADDTPDIEIAFAARASMSIPTAFHPIQLTVQGKTSTYTDGGEGSNMPTEAILNGAQSPLETKARTMAMHFDNGGSAHKDLHQPEERRVKPSFFIRWLAGKPYMDVCQADARKAHEMSSNAMVVHHGELGTLSFWASHESLMKSKATAWEGAARHAENTRNQAYAVKYARAEDCYAQLSVEEKRSLRGGALSITTRPAFPEDADKLKAFRDALIALAQADPDIDRAQR